MNNTQQTLARNGTANRFRVTDISRHQHTTINSPPTVQPVLFYTGRVVYNTLTNLFVADNPFPNSITVSTITVGSEGGAQLTHNIGNSKSYTVFITPEVQNNITISGEVIRQDNYVQVILSSGGASVSGNFYFLIMVVNNTSQSLPTYTI